jgi:hypothetical protein
MSIGHRLQDAWHRQQLYPTFFLSGVVGLFFWCSAATAHRACSNSVAAGAHNEQHALRSMQIMYLARRSNVSAVCRNFMWSKSVRGNQDCQMQGSSQEELVHSEPCLQAAVLQLNKLC